MKTTKIYIEVPVSERLPEKYSFVFTDMGKGFVNEENNWIDYDINDIYPSYWLELVEVPTDEEILNETYIKQDNHQTPFLLGVEWILQKLKINQNWNN
jgi:hypothetical protein